MIGRVALIVIAAALLVAMIKRSLRAKVPAARPPRRVESTRKCPACGAYVIDGEACSCGREA